MVLFGVMVPLGMGMRVSNFMDSVVVMTVVKGGVTVGAIDGSRVVR